ncbi:TetR/AcrR family transcriptional regulator [Nocardiopsis metallicus]|uniref:AcrR family transcriptional regulator n=1 Tax=Nocardiopsis metallicus TaxID=179819 RepID=A0A840WDY8_9ACTN|nr:TetR/AcrR family transcriptional regulator [Nocardiopsis metallicus]MBB5491221.1 AcrR family transcriptional regulator [Nocardiopsis metallicus]
MPKDTGARAEQRARTRSSLIRQGRRLFTEHGYGGVGLAEIVAAAEVTKGALYHHFDGKAALFRAVLEQVQREVGAAVAEAADARTDPWEQLTAGCRAFLATSTAPDVRRIMLVDGPAVLGWREWRALDDSSSARHLAEALTSLIEAGLLAPQPVAPLARLLSGAMNEAALWLADSGGAQEGEQALEDVWSPLSRMLESLRDRDN